MEDAMQMILTEVDPDAEDSQSAVMQDAEARQAAVTAEQVSGAAAGEGAPGNRGQCCCTLIGGCGH